jgi:hypothetical protein
MSVESAVNALSAALADVEDLRVYTDPGAALDPPAAFVGPPVLSWTGAPGGEPNLGQFLVILTVAQDDRSLPRLWSLLPSVVDALESVTDAVVISAAPGTWRTGAVDLPCYEIKLEMSLN